MSEKNAGFRVFGHVYRRSGILSGNTHPPPRTSIRAGILIRWDATSRRQPPVSTNPVRSVLTARYRGLAPAPTLRA